MLLGCCDRYRAVAKTNTTSGFCALAALGRRAGIAIAQEMSKTNSNSMLLEKTLHMSQPLAECKARLASIQSYRRQFLMVTRATVTSSKTVDFSFRGPFGFEAHTVLLSVDSDSPNQYAFESVGGNISLMGIVDFAEIRPHCTEVTLAVHYEIKNKLFAWLDRRLHFVDSFVTAELRSIRAHFEGIRSSYLERVRVMPVLQPAHA
jgi:uncharacterized membrane protein